MLTLPFVTHLVYSGWHKFFWYTFLFCLFKYSSLNCIRKKKEKKRIKINLISFSGQIVAGSLILITRFSSSSSSSSFFLYFDGKTNRVLICQAHKSCLTGFQHQQRKFLSADVCNVKRDTRLYLLRWEHLNFRFVIFTEIE